MDKAVIVWFRRDLRIEDHAALAYAARTAEPIIPLFIADTRLISELPSDGAIFDFQAACLKQLDEELRRKRNRLIILSGTPEEVFECLFKQLRPKAIFYNRDYEPYARERDACIEALARRFGVQANSFKDHVLVEPWEVATESNKPFMVFSAFRRAWEKVSKCSTSYSTPLVLQSAPILKSETLPTAKVLGKKITLKHWAVEPGEAQARKQWKVFCRKGLPLYSKTRDFPSVSEATSRMSPHLRFGTISIRRLYSGAAKLLGTEAHASAEKFISELIWREFFQHLLWHFPQMATQSLRPRIDHIPWQNNQKLFKAWCEGCTGYPLVDAAMRELHTTGYIHNRARMVAASFLVKNLHIDWRLGERYFRSKLLDGELGSNVGNWQWIASAGPDPRPLRIFNPVLQSLRYDPEGNYIRRWVPELAKLPKKSVHAPWQMSLSQQTRLGMRLNIDYPLPLVDYTKSKIQFEKLYYTSRQKSRLGK